MPTVDERNRMLLAIMPSIVKHASRVSGPGVSFDDVKHEMIVRMIRRIDGCGMDSIEGREGWFAWNAKFDAIKSLGDCRAGYGDAVIPDRPVDTDPVSYVAIQQLRAVCDTTILEAVLLEGMTHEEAGTDKHSFGSAVRRAREYLEGGKKPDAPNRSDGARYRFVHKDGRSFFGTRVEFCAHSGVTVNGCHKIVSGLQKTHKGWSIEG